MTKRLKKNIKKKWKKHGKFVITGGQIITILTLITGLYTTHIEAQKNTAAIKSSNKWIGDNLGTKTESISELKSKEAHLEFLITNQSDTRN